MPWTNFPFGISLTTATGTVAGQLTATLVSAGAIITSGGSTVTGTVTAGSVSATGSITGANASVYGVRIPIGIGTGGQYSVALTSALFVSAPTSGFRAPGIGVFEIVWITGATGSVTGSLRVTASSVSTGADLTTLTVGSATTQAATIYTTIGSVSIAQGTEFTVTSAVMATANSSVVQVNFIPTAS